jgi:hypothetical protein
MDWPLKSPTAGEVAALQGHRERGLRESVFPVSGWARVFPVKPFVPDPRLCGLIRADCPAR